MQTAANKGVLLAFVAMAQTLVVITAGIDLSVGMIFMLTNCLASWIVVGSPLADRARRHRRARASAPLCGAHQRRHRHLSAGCSRSSTTIATGAIYFGIALALRPFPGGSVNGDLADLLTGKVFDVVPGEPGGAGRGRAGRLGAVQPLGDRPRRLCRRLVGGRRLHVGRADQAGEVRRLYAVRPARLDRRPVPDLLHLYRRGRLCARGNTYTLFSIAAVVLGGVSLFGGTGSAIGAIFGALAFRTIGDLLFVFDFDPLWQPLFQGVVLMLAVSLGAFGLFRVRNRLDWFA